MDSTTLRQIAKQSRRDILMMVYRANYGHIGASFSSVDIMTVLFFDEMKYDLRDPVHDRFVLSKGHASEALYCTLMQKGFIEKTEFENFTKPDALLTAHPTNHIPGIDFCTGALGHGLSLAMGMALGSKKSGCPYKVFTLVGDGEMDEGSNWEVILSAPCFHLGNLVLVIDNNGLQLNDTVSNTLEIQPFGEKIAQFGWDVKEVMDGNDIDQLKDAFSSLDYNGIKPHAIVAHTVKGKGVSFMENVVSWHHKVPNENELAMALEELK